MADKWTYKQRWQKLNELGHGGQANIARVQRIASPNESAVLKTLTKGRDPICRRRMLREVSCLRQVHFAGGNVPRIIEENVTDKVESGDLLYLIEEYISGTTLESYVTKNGTLGIDVAVVAIQSLCRTMQVAHSIPVLHRDLKPDNLMLRDGAFSDLVVIDFGLSCSDGDDTITDADVTFRNRFLDLQEHNTANGDKRNTASDVSSIAAILH